MYNENEELLKEVSGFLIVAGFILTVLIGSITLGIYLFGFIGGLFGLAITPLIVGLLILYMLKKNEKRNKNIP